MSVTYVCPDGHSSTDPEYCSECGKRLSTVTSPAPVAPTVPIAASTAGEACPDCGTARASASAVFCEVCRYNFLTRTPWSPGSLTPVTPTPPQPVPVEAAPAPTLPPVAVADPIRRWEAIVVVDPSLYADPDPAIPCPVDTPERLFPLDFAENLIGRRSERRAIFPEIDLSDDHGVSSRHAVLYREADGALSLLDVGSTNGTQLNGKDVTSGVRTPLQEGDQITLGCWTRITLRTASGNGGAKP